LKSILQAQSLPAGVPPVDGPPTDDGELVVVRL
jgi:hypothetical protein